MSDKWPKYPVTYDKSEYNGWDVVLSVSLRETQNEKGDLVFLTRVVVAATKRPYEVTGLSIYAKGLANVETALSAIKESIDCFDELNP